MNCEDFGFVILGFLFGWFRSCLSWKKKRGFLLGLEYCIGYWQVDDVTADFIISQLLFLDAEDPTKDIKLFINSPGGSVTAGIFHHQILLSFFLFLFFCFQTDKF